MGKSRRGSKEFTREQRLAQENKQLKQQLAQIRKQLARIDLDRYDSIKEMLEEHNQADEPQTGTELLESLKKTWLCNDCRQGHLEIIIYTKLDSANYYRKCSYCPNRTRAQKYSPSVQGIMKKSELLDINRKS